MANIVAQVQEQLRATDALLGELLRNPAEVQQMRGLLASGVDAKRVARLYPALPETYPVPLRKLLASAQRPAWLCRELSKLDPTAYCLHLPQEIYGSISPHLPPLPKVPQGGEAELAYAGAFVSLLAAEDLSSHAQRAGRDELTSSERQLWEGLLHHICQIQRMLRALRAQQSPAGRLAYRMRAFTR